jgi:LacI family transcriptional regulator
MACNDICGRRVLEACASIGLRVPEDIAVVGVDNDEMICELSSPALSSVVLDLERAGYEAATLLHRMMLGESIPDRRILVQPTFIATRQSSDVVAPKDPYVTVALQFVSSQVGVSRRTLEKHFHGALGRSIASEITRSKLERAKRILREPVFLPIVWPPPPASEASRHSIAFFVSLRGCPLNTSGRA